MLAWITENIGTILISAGLLLIVVLIIVKLVKDKKKGKSSCGCNCAHCAMSAPATRSNKATGGETRMEASAFPLCLNRR